ncbi:MAG: CDC48 family AAA ATPase [Candidatus Diapherotrites archaeon]|nr:CDC48 family AAA ATPase [Candidatus Diapherotrites archaeon]
MAEKKEIVLRVEEPDPAHVGRSIITLDKKTKDLLGITSGDIVEIEGTRKTAAVVWPARQEDENKGIIRMDHLIRKNCGTALGEKVVVRKAVVEEAKKAEIAPTEPIKIIAKGYERILKRNFIGRPLVKGDRIWVSGFGSGFVYQVIDTIPKGIVKVTDFTQFIIREEPVKGVVDSAVPKVSYEDIGGLDEQIQKVRELIELPMKHPEIFRRLGIQPPKGVLLHGPPGTGKTLLAKAVASETEAHFIPIDGPSIMSKFVGEAEEKIRQIFKEAKEKAPSIIFFDELDAIAPKRDEVVGEVERRVVAQILTAMDGMEARGNVIVIGATNRVNSIDEALRRPGRFDREIEFPVPDKKGRKQILQIHTRGMPLDENVNLDYLASITHGFVGADLEVLAKEAAMKALRRYLPKINLDEDTIPEEILESLKVTKDDFLDALKEVQPSALREITVEIPNVKWADIGGLDKIKEEIKEAVEWPLKNPKIFKEMGIRPTKGILLYGPPGTGKTLLAKAVATESEANFISIKGPELVSKWVGETERGIRSVFRKARQVSPVVVFFDEIDAIAVRRSDADSVGTRVYDSALNQLLTELDGIESIKDIVVIGATNRPDLLDPALLRPGRFDKLIYVPAPDEKARLAILKVHTKNVPLDDSVNLQELARKLEGYSGADIEGLVREAALLCIRENKNKAGKVKKEHFEKAMQKIYPTISKEISDSYESFSKQYVNFKPTYIR